MDLLTIQDPPHFPHLTDSHFFPHLIFALYSQPSHGVGLLSFPHLVCIDNWEVGDSRLSLLKIRGSPTRFPLYPPVSCLLYCLMN
ncbi:hypothetical protein A6J66_013920 [Yersinia enterocolitica]|nr:hypothetical protein A6J66_013920 [Yersinia enterocolitica]